MKLTIEGSVHRMMQSANFGNTLENLPELVGKRLGQSVNDVYLRIDSVEADKIHFAYIYFDEETPVTLALGEQYDFRVEQNAFGFCIRYRLED